MMQLSRTKRRITSGASHNAGWLQAMMSGPGSSACCFKSSSETRMIPSTSKPADEQPQNRSERPLPEPAMGLPVEENPGQAG